MSKGFTKDPTADLDYAFLWGDWLAPDETIVSHTITVPKPGLNLDDHSVLGGVVTVWLSGGILGTRYSIHCHVVTSEGREDTRSITVFVEDR